LSLYSFKDTIKVREYINKTIATILQDALQMPLHVRVLNSSVSHDELIPEGDLFYITLRVEVHPRQEEKKDGVQPDHP
jgi:hypothetical protein